MGHSCHRAIVYSSPEQNGAFALRRNIEEWWRNFEDFQATNRRKGQSKNACDEGLQGAERARERQRLVSH